MANNKSAKKRVLVAERNRVRNRAVRTALRTQVRRFRSAVASGDATEVARLLPAVHATIDKSAKKGVIHENTARRYKSRLALAQRRLAGAQGAS
jgi:small subunit ribosomal protein S20